jgi:hypothetical protein
MILICQNINCRKKFKTYRSKRKYHSHKCFLLTVKGRKHPPRSEEWKRKVRIALTGKKRAPFKESTRRKLSELRKGKNCNFWKGGVTPEHLRIKMSIEWKLWREAVFTRDNWTCQKYGVKGGTLHPHHIKNFSDNKELRFAIDNGITLSKRAHREFHKKYGNINNTREQLIEFLNN